MRYYKLAINNGYVNLDNVAISTRKDLEDLVEIVSFLLDKMEGKQKPYINNPISINIDSLIKGLNINTGGYSSKENEEIREKIKQALLESVNSAIDMATAKNDL